MRDNRAGYTVTKITKLDARRIQLNEEKLLMSLESLRLPRATRSMRKKVSRVEREAN